MSTTTRKKNPCSKCQKAAGIMTCGGCNRIFCYQHVLEHRQELNKEMDVVISHHDQFQATINEQKENISKHPLMQKIDQWEKDSIEKIHQEAKRVRESLLMTIGTHTNTVNDKLKSLTAELNRGQTDNDYVETDIKEWLNTLEKLKKDLNNSVNVDFNPKTDVNTLVSRILVNGVSNDYFAEKYGEVEILEDGCLIEKGYTQNVVILRGAGKYSSGKHKFSFILDKFGQNQNFYCGIIAQGSSLHTIASSFPNSNGHWNHWDDPYRLNSSFYNNGQSNILPGILHCNLDGSRRNINIEFIVDCDNRTIHSSLTKERKNVNINQFPFPWSFFIAIDRTEARVRISQTKNEFDSAFVSNRRRMAEGD